MEDFLSAADRLVEVAEHGQHPMPSTSSSRYSTINGVLEGDAPFLKLKDFDVRTIEERLLELHIEESLKEGVPWCSHLNPCANLLSLICKRERFNRLLLTLHSDDDGYYMVHVVMADGRQTQLLKLPYEEDDFLSCVDNQELPVTLLDIFDSSCPDLFYSGCIIVEIRDLRRRPLELEEVSHVLLRPTTQSLICDSNLIAERLGRPGPTTSEERAVLEGQLALVAQPPLCLDPDPVVSVLARKSCVNQQKLATTTVRRTLKKYSQVGVNRKRKLEQCASTGDIKIYDFILNVNKNHKKISPQEVLQKHQAAVRSNSRLASLKTGPDALNSGIITPTVLPQPGEVANYARQLPKRGETNDMTPHIVEEYILETAERGTARIYHTRLTIYQRLANDEYLGELYVERDYRENDNKGSTCRFALGTRTHALRYINQFTEIFTEEGRKSVKITHRVPNKPPRVTYTPGVRERMNAAAAAAAAVNNSGAGVSAPGGTPGKFLPIKANTGPSILQQTLSAPSIMSSPSPVTLQQLPLHPVPIESVGSQMLRPNAMPQPMGLLQNQLTIQTSLQPPLLPMTPHPNTPSSNNLVSPQQPVMTPSTPQDAGPAPSPMTLEQHPQVVSSGNNNNIYSNNNNDQEIAISAIMASLIKDTAQFETGLPQQQQLPQTPANLVRSVTSPRQLVGGAQLPTCPVPQASLEGVIGSPVKQTGPLNTLATGGPSTSVSNAKLLPNRVTLQNLLTSQVPLSSPSPQQQQIKVTVSQLAAQLSRPVLNSTSVSLPTYTQALAQARATSPTTKLVLTQQPNLVRSMEGGKNMMQDSPGLQALLANTPSADNPNPMDNMGGGPTITVATSGGSLLERLVMGQPVVTSGNLGASMTSRMTVNTGQQVDSTNEITLAALLAKPTPNLAAHHQPQTSPMSSPTKMSPLLQQLQQPIPPPRPSLTSPQQVQSPSGPVQSPRPQPSPRMIQPSKSPAGNFNMNPSPQPSPRQTSTLQQHLMQPPKSQQPQNSILSAHLQQPMVSMASSHPLPVQELQGTIVTTADGMMGNSNLVNAGGNMVSLQSLLQGGMVQVSAADASSLLQKQPIKVTSSISSSTTSIPVQLSIPGLNAPVTLSVSLPDGVHQAGGMNQQQVAKTAATLVTSMGKIMTTHAPMGSSTVFLRSAGGNLIRLPQQAVSSGGNLANVIKPLMSSGHQIQLQPNQLITSGGHLLQVRQASGSNGPQQVFLQMPQSVGNSGQTISAVTSCGQPFQIVRSVQPTIVRPQQPSPQQHQQHIIINPVNSLKSPQSMGGAGGGIPPSPSSVTSPRQPQLTPPMQQQQMNSDGNNLVAIQLQGENQNQSQQLLLGGTINHLTQAQLRVRQQRKQSLK